MTAGGLQDSLDVASTWAHENGMKWNTKKSVILRSKYTQGHEFFFSGVRLRSVIEVKYLGRTITEEGISDSKLVDRIKKAENVLGVLRRLGVFTNGVHPARSIRLYKSLVQSRWEYCLHLTPWTNRVAAEVRKVESMFFGQVFGKIAKRNVHTVDADRCAVSSIQKQGEIYAHGCL